MHCHRYVNLLEWKVNQIYLNIYVSVWHLGKTHVSILCQLELCCLPILYLGKCFGLHLTVCGADYSSFLLGLWRVKELIEGKC